MQTRSGRFRHRQREGYRNRGYGLICGMLRQCMADSIVWMLTVTLTFLRSLHVRLCMLIFWLFLAFVNSRCQRTPVRFSNAGNTQANNGLLRCHRATRPVRQLSEYTDHVQHYSVHRKSRWVQTQRVVGLQSGDSSSSYLECLQGKSLTALTVV